MKTSSLPPSADGFVPTWSCSRRGLPGHRYYYRCRWSFTPPFHSCYPGSAAPLPMGKKRRNKGATCFCGPRPAGWLLAEASPPRVLSDAVLYGVRTFLDPDNAGPRSPNRPEALSSYTQGTGASTAPDSFAIRRIALEISSKVIKIEVNNPDLTTVQSPFGTQKNADVR